MRNRISSVTLILLMISCVRGNLTSLTSARISDSLHDTQRGSRFKMLRQAEAASGSGKNKYAHDSVAVASSNLRNGGVQYVGERSVVSVKTSAPKWSAK